MLLSVIEVQNFSEQKRQPANLKQHMVTSSKNDLNPIISIGTSALCSIMIKSTSKSESTHVR